MHESSAGILLESSTDSSEEECEHYQILVSSVDVGDEEYLDFYIVDRDVGKDVLDKVLTYCLACEPSKKINKMVEILDGNYCADPLPRELFVEAMRLKSERVMKICREYSVMDDEYIQFIKDNLFSPEERDFVVGDDELWNSVIHLV